MSHSTFTARQILDLVREHGITATLEDEDSVPALADAGNEDCYPTITIALSAGDWTAEVTGWKVCWWEMGRNRRDNGAWIGDGWHWLADGLGIDTYQRTPGWISTKDLGHWRLPVWNEPREIRRCRFFFRPRGKHSGASWSRWLREREDDAVKWLPYRIVDTGGKTYCIFGPEQTPWRKLLSRTTASSSPAQTTGKRRSKKRAKSSSV